MHLVEYKLCPSDVKVLHPLKLKLNPIQNFIRLRLSISKNIRELSNILGISNRKQKPLDQARFLF